MLTKTPFDDLCDLIRQFPGPNDKNRDAVNEKLAGYTPAGDCGISNLVRWLSAWQEDGVPRLDEAHICVLVSSYKHHENTDEVLSFAARAGKGATVVNQLCKDRGIGLRVLEMAPDIPHEVNENWTERDCMAACAFGMEATASGGHLIGLSSLAPGSEGFCQDLISKVDIEKQYINSNNSSITLDKNPLDIMRTTTGREVAASVGAIVAARSRRIPVLAEGWPALAALHVLKAMSPKAIDHVQIASVICAEQQRAASLVGKVPILGPFNMLGPGTGLAMAVSTIAPLLALVT